MNTATAPSISSTKSEIAATIRAIALIMALIASAVGAVNFAFIFPSELGFYLSVAAGAFTIDPLRRLLFSRDDNSRRG